MDGGDLLHCRCGQHRGTFLPAPGHAPGKDVLGTCFMDGEPWPCRMSVQKHEDDYHCTCPDIMLDGRPTGSKNISDSCPDHGVGTLYYRERAEYWNSRLREIREGRDARPG